ncbi:MAG: DUF4215 domain-containing protein [Polyangiaceae bacterium]
MLTSCEHCAGFLPSGATACPNCERPRSSENGVSPKSQLAMLALSAVSSMTLMACYGAPNDYACDTQHPELTRTPQALSQGDTDVSPISCGTTSGPTYAFTIHPNEPSIATLRWSNQNALSIAQLNCEGSTELNCFAPNDTGTSTFEVLGSQTLAISGVDTTQAADTRIWIEFTPTCGDGILQSYEQCDDGARVNGDGCSEYCYNEGGVGE